MYIYKSIVFLIEYQEEYDEKSEMERYCCNLFDDCRNDRLPAD